MDALLGDDEGRVIDGTSATFFNLQESGVAKLSTVTAKRDYTRLFVSQLRAETRFAIVDSVEHVRREFGDSPALSDVVIRPWRAERAPPGGEPRYVAAMLYKDHLYEATLVLWRKKPRVVEMIEDRPLAGPLALPGEVFDGPLRLLPQPQS